MYLYIFMYIYIYIYMYRYIHKYMYINVCTYIQHKDTDILSHTHPPTTLGAHKDWRLIRLIYLYVHTHYYSRRAQRLTKTFTHTLTKTFTHA